MRSLKLRIVYFFARLSPVCESAVQPQKIQSQFFCLAIVYLRISCTALQNSPNLRLLTTSAYNPHSTALYSPHFAPRLVVSGQRPCPPKRGQDNGQARGVVASGQFGQDKTDNTAGRKVADPAGRSNNTMSDSLEELVTTDG